jgi:hypothetical protein
MCQLLSPRLRSRNASTCRLNGSKDTIGVLDPLAQEIVVLAALAPIEHAVDVEARQKLTQVKREIAFLHLPERHDVIAERAAHLEHRVLHDLEHGISNNGPDTDLPAVGTPRDHCVIGRRDD